MTSRSTKLLVPLAVSVLALSACSGGDAAGSDPDASSTSAGSAALVIAQGGLGDESFNDLAYAGFQTGLEAAGMTGTPIESADIVGQGEQILRRAAQTDAGLVIDLEYSHNELLPTVAADFPDTSWVLVNAEAAGDNIASVLFQEQEASYLAGALAAMVTQDPDDPQVNPEKIIGVIGGTESVGIDKFIVGFIQGAHDVDPEVQVLTAYSNDFADPTKGQQLAQTMFDQGADIVYAVAGGTGAGVIQAAVDNDHYAIGVDDDQDGVAPGHVLTSVLKRTDVAMSDIIARYAAGDFPGGETVTYGLADDGVGLTDFTYTKDAIGQSTIDAVDALAAKIVSGDITVWNTVTQGYPDFYGN
jgi:basic membrane protein A and related proteins